MKQGIQDGVKLVGVNVEQMLVFAVINKGEIKINADVSVKNQLTKVDLIKDLFGILVIVNVNVINHVMSENIQIKNVVSAEKNQSISQSKYVVKIMVKM